MKIGFIGFGEASSNIAIGMLSEKKESFVVYDADYKRAESLIIALGLQGRINLVETLRDALAMADVLFVAVPGKYDEVLFQDILSESTKEQLFIDLCTAPPDIKRKIEMKLTTNGSMYVDVAVMGSVPTLKHRVPMYISGSGAERMKDELTEYRFDMTIVGEKAGEASVIKLCRSIYMKGIAALSIEMTNVCEYYGVKDKVYESLANSLDGDCFTNYTPRLINGTIKHRERRLQEVRECLEIIKKAGIKGEMTQGTIELYENLK